MSGENPSFKDLLERNLVWFALAMMVIGATAGWFGYSKLRATIRDEVRSQLPELLKTDKVLAEAVRGEKGDPGENGGPGPKGDLGPKGDPGSPGVTLETLRWTAVHAAAGAACSATSDVGNSPWARIAIPRHEGRTCADSCQFETDGAYTKCSTSIAVGNLLTQRVSSYGQVVANYYNYGCSDNQQAYDAVKAGSSIATYAAYCCCYH